jgi:hypothetical protein
MMGNTMNISHNAFSYRSLTVAARIDNRPGVPHVFRRERGCVILTAGVPHVFRRGNKIESRLG